MEIENILDVDQYEQAIEALSEEIVKVRNRNKALLETIVDLQSELQEAVGKLYAPAPKAKEDEFLGFPISESRILWLWHRQKYGNELPSATLERLNSRGWADKDREQKYLR